MIVIPPILITSSVLASSTVAEPSAGEVVWNAATSYAGTEIAPTAGTNPANSVIGNSFITWLATGTRLGPISA